MMQQPLNTGWQGFLSFTLERQAQRTVVKDKKHLGPLVLQRPYYQEIGRPMILVIHPPGGVVGGDELELQVRMRPGAEGMLSTPAATKFYRSNGCRAQQRQAIFLSQGNQLEWLPQETLFFDKSIVSNDLKFYLDSADNRLIAWDIVGLGRPESGEDYSEGELRQTLEVWLENKPVFIDRLSLKPGSTLLRSAAGMNGHSLFATLLLYSNESEKQSELLELLQSVEWEINLGVTRMGDLIVVRALSSSLDELKRALSQCWELSRPFILERQAIRPRIWNT